MAKGLEDPTIEWTITFPTLIKEFSWEQSQVQNRAYYIDIAGIMFGAVKSYGSMTYAAGP